MLRCRLFLLLVPFGFIGCAALYVPDSRSTIIIEEAGEIQADVSYGNSGFEIKAAYSITDYVGIGYAGSFLNRTNDAVFFKPHEHAYNELMGIVNAHELGEHAELSFTAGAGSGKSSAYDDFVGNSGEELNTKGKFNRFYVQPTISLKHEKATYGFVGRFSVVNFSKIESSNPNNRNSLDGYYFEPSFFIRTGGDKFRFLIQVGASSSIDDASRNAFNHEIYHVSMGIGLNLSNILIGKSD